MHEGLIPILLAQDETPSSGKSLMDHIVSGGPIGLVIITLSLIAVALMIMHLVQIRAGRFAPQHVVDGLDRRLSKNDVAGAISFCRAKENDSFVARIFLAALTRCSKSPFGLLELRAALEEAGQDQTARLYRSTDGIGLIAAVAPMLGLLGTVVGMVGAFDTISVTEGFARPDQLAGSISVALITTVMGLIVAIPCTAVFTFFRNRIDHLAVEVGQTIEALSGRLQDAPEGGGATGRPSRPAAPRAAPSEPRKEAATQ